MNEVLTEQEQIEQIKNWWKENGTQVMLAVVVVAAGYFGFQWWKDSKEAKLEAVTSAYTSYTEALAKGSAANPPSEEDQKTVDYLTDQIIEKYSGSHYAVLAAINTAAFDVRNGDLASADQRFSWAGENVKEPADVLLLRYRHALLKAQLGETDQALNMLVGADDAFASLFAEARGDIQLTKANTANALAEYQLARDSILVEDAERLSLLNVKISSLETGAGSTIGSTIGSQ